MNKVYICNNISRDIIPADCLYELCGGLYIITNLIEADKTAFALIGITLDELLERDNEVIVFEDGYGKVYEYIEDAYHRLTQRMRCNNDTNTLL